jgi:hypothetical protein
MVGAVTCFGLSFSVIKWPGTSGAVIAWWRLVASTGIWWVVLAVLRLRGRPLPSRETWRAVVPAALSFGLNISLMFVSVTRTSVAHSQFIVALAPLVLAPLGLVMFQERPAVAGHFVGVRSVSEVWWSCWPSARTTASRPLKAICSRSEGCSGSSATSMFTKRARARGVGTLDFVAILMPVAVVTATPVAALTSDSLWPASGETWVAIAILAVLTGMIAHGFLVFAQRSVPIVDGRGDPGVSAGAVDVLGVGVPRGVDRVRSGSGNGARDRRPRSRGVVGAARGGAFRHAHTGLSPATRQTSKKDEVSWLFDITPTTTVVGVEILPSARKHGVSDDDITHAINNAIAAITRHEQPEFTMLIGPTINADLLEIGVVETDDQDYVIHAMPARDKYLSMIESNEGDQ